MANNNYTVSNIIENGWQQGVSVLIERNDVLDKYNNPLKFNSRYFVISQNCDIVNPDIKKEPYVELIYANEIEKVNGKNITENDLKVLIYWLNNRYSRAAYPDEFNRRLRHKKSDKKLKK